MTKMERIYNILVSILGESKQGYYDKNTFQYQMNCPKCKEENGGVPDGKYNLEVNLQLMVYKCWKCSSSDGKMQGSLSNLIKKYGKKSDFDEFLRIINELKESKFYNKDLFKTLLRINADGELLKLPKTFQKVDLSKNIDKRLKSYLEKRNITQDIINRYNIGWTNNLEEKPSMKNRLIIPSYDENGYLNYWTGRDFTGNEKRFKYWNSKTDKNEIIFQESHIRWDADIYLVEGAIDCIYGNGNVISMLGKVLKRNTKLYDTLKEKANAKVIICLDGDVEIHEIKKIYKTLNNGRLKGKIWYMRLGTDEVPYKDFGEIYESEGKTGIINAMKTIKQFSEFDLINKYEDYNSLCGYTYTTV